MPLSCKPLAYTDCMYSVYFPFFNQMLKSKVDWSYKICYSSKIKGQTAIFAFVIKLACSKR